ncbi:hypothetical protein PSTEL_11725 [Paenibacillus stellifer]|uniref:DoxX family protein n=1 Tax=Paenibacillus stellifer TaxID=169760 RepID=A0A089LWK8_9BACL|nr:DoxX family protein [Paenibacillus stellifer]AIQ63648.1 hypothetical protein PSTEL_11725 [Paenibacillus stellifer]
MVPFIVLIASFVLLRLLGLLGLDYLDEWQHPLQIACALMLITGASAHFGRRRADLVAMVPPSLYKPGFMVTLTGCLEIAGASGLLIPPIAQSASWCLAILLIAMFPANVHASRMGLSIGGRPVPALEIRLLIQLLFIAAILMAGWPEQ